MMKPAYRSRTILVNFVTVLACLIPGVRKLVAEYPELVTITVALANIALRFATRVPVSWFLRFP
jgi:hypothetical protein